MRHGKIGTAQGTKVKTSASEIFQINAHAQHNEPAHFGYDIRKFNRDFPDFTKDFKISTQISLDFRISTEISGFRERVQISREISGKVYEISVSGGPLGPSNGCPSS